MKKLINDVSALVTVILSDGDVQTTVLCAVTEGDGSP
jgi:hypothetical protein